MDFLEKDLETIIYETAQNKEGRMKLSERGLDIQGKLLRQVRIGAYGIADLITVEINRYNDSKHINITIYELKKGALDLDALTQASRYETGIRSFIKQNYYDEDSHYLTVNIILIGRDVEYNSDFLFLLNKCMDRGDVGVYTYSYDIDGLKFDRQYSGWSLTEEVFEPLVANFHKIGFADVKQMLGALDK